MLGKTAVRVRGAGAHQASRVDTKRQQVFSWPKHWKEDVQHDAASKVSLDYQEIFFPHGRCPKENASRKIHESAEGWGCDFGRIGIGKRQMR